MAKAFVTDCRSRGFDLVFSQLGPRVSVSAWEPKPLQAEAAGDHIKMPTQVEVKLSTSMWTPDWLEPEAD